MALWVILLFCAEVFFTSLVHGSSHTGKGYDNELLRSINTKRGHRQGRDYFTMCPGGSERFIPKDWTCTEDLDEKILDGLPASRSDYPWFVYIEKDGRKICGGMVILSRWIVTAAHCFTEVLEKRKHKLEKSGNETRCIKVGNYYANVYNDGYIGIDIVRFHFLYGDIRFKFKGDLAFGHLEHNLQLHRYRTPQLCLKVFHFPITDKCTILGYGATDYNGRIASTNLNQQQINLRRCPPELGRSPHHDQQNMICSNATAYGENGDSGGPVICKDENSNRFYLAGILKSVVRSFNVFTGFQKNSRYLCALLEFLQLSNSNRNEGCPVEYTEIL